MFALFSKCVYKSTGDKYVSKKAASIWMKSFLKFICIIELKRALYGSKVGGVPAKAIKAILE